MRTAIQDSSPLSITYMTFTDTRIYTGPVLSHASLHNPAHHPSRREVSRKGVKSNRAIIHQLPSDLLPPPTPKEELPLPFSH
jgi:hypothetical protein